MIYIFTIEQILAMDNIHRNLLWASIFGTSIQLVDLYSKDAQEYKTPLVAALFFLDNYIIKMSENLSSV